MKTNYVIVVGVDGSESGRKALQWAVREAHLRGGSVQAVTAWRWDYPEVRAEGTGPAEAKLAETLLEHEIESLPVYQIAGVSIAHEVVEGRAAQVLVDAARDADLLVLGSHGKGRALHQVLGSVSEECIRNATCPVVVLPYNAEARRAAALPVKQEAGS